MRIQRTHTCGLLNRTALTLVVLAGVLDALVYLLSLSYLTSNFHAALLFSDWVQSTEH